MNDINNMIYYETIEIQNFKSIGYVFFDFRKHSGLNFVYGWDPVLCTSNGVGKSTFLVDAPLFALFGNTAKKMKMGNIANRSGNRKKCFVKLTFRINGKRWRVEKGISPDFYNVFEIKDDGTEVSKNKGKKETLEYVRDVILNSNEDVYKYSIIMSIVNNCNVFNMKAEDKRNFISKVFQYSDLTLMNKTANDIYKELEKSLNLERTQNNIFVKNLETYNQKEIEFQGVKTQEIDILKQEIIKLAAEYKSFVVIDPTVFTEKIRELDKQMTELEKTIEANNKQIEGFEKDIEVKREEIKVVNKDKETMVQNKNDKLSKISTIQNTIKTLESVKNRIINSKTGLLDFIKSKASLTEFTDPSFADFYAELDKLSDKIMQLHKKDTYDETISTFEDIINNWKKEIQDKEDDTAKLLELISDNNKKISKAEIAIGSKATENIGNEEFINKYKDVLDIVCKDCHVKVDNLFNITAIKTKNHDNDLYSDKLKKAITQLEASNVSLQDKISKNKFFVQKTKDMIIVQEKEIQSVRKEKQKHADSISAINNKQNQIREVISSYEEREESNDEFILEHNEIIEGNKDPDSIDKIIQKHNTHIKELEKGNINYDTLMGTWNKTIENIETAILDIQKQITDIKTLNRNIEYVEKKTIMNSVVKVNADALENEKISHSKKTLMDKINDKKKFFEEKKASKSPYDELIEKTKTDIEKSNKSIEVIMDNRNYYEIIELATSEEGVRKDLITNIINMLNLTVKIYLEKMGSAYTVVFDQEFDAKFITSTGECAIDDFSSGELRKLEIATIFAIRDILQLQGVLQSNMIVCDEIIDGAICDRTVESIINMVKEEAKNKTVFLVSHRYKDENKMVFDNIIKLEKKREVSSIIEDKQQEPVNKNLE